MLKSLEGKKTYIIAFIGAAVSLAQAFGVEIPESILGILMFLGIGTMRGSISRIL